MLDGVSDAFDVQDQWAVLSLDVAYQVVVVLHLSLWTERYVDWNLRVRLNYPRDWVDIQAVSVRFFTLNRGFIEMESEWDVFLIQKQQSLFGLPSDQQRTKINFPFFKFDYRFIHDSNH